MLETILNNIPQREPFLFIENIIEQTENSITTSRKLTGEEDFFRGHFPGRPVFPGVLMCEAVFQTGALLMSLRGEGTGNTKTAVVTRIQNTKFKNLAKPGDLLLITVNFVEMLANAAFMKGKITCDGKTIMTIEFAAALVENGDV
ncbi:MAG: 3-hydroxyacyl-ACP dehydratase FabZ family protein [Bacteriovoracia bacterium]